MSNVFVLLDGAADRDHEQQNPGHANFCKHLEIDMCQPRVQAGTHEDIVHPDTRHTHRLAAVVESTCENIDQQGDCERSDDGCAHDFTKVVDQVVKLEHAGVVESEGENDSCVERGEGVAVISQGLVPERRNGKSLLLDTRHDKSKEELDDNKANVDLEGILGGICVLE